MSVCTERGGSMGAQHSHFRAGAGRYRALGAVLSALLVLTVLPSTAQAAPVAAATQPPRPMPVGYPAPMPAASSPSVQLAPYAEGQKLTQHSASPALDSIETGELLASSEEAMGLNRAVHPG